MAGALTERDFVTKLERRRRDANDETDRGGFAKTPESLLDDASGQPVGSVYWAGDVTFKGRVSTLLSFNAALKPMRAFPLRVKVVSAALREPLSADFEIVPPEREPIRIVGLPPSPP